jgi:type IV secretion system protein VirD4
MRTKLPRSEVSPLLDDLPRGVPERPAGRDTTPHAHWLPPADLLADPRFRFDPMAPGARVFLGAAEGTLIGLADDRHMMTVAGSRAGKGVCAIVPNLLTYDGSVLAIDPKGELACITASWRHRGLGQRVHVLDPFRRVAGEAAGYRAAFNPLSILRDPRSGALGAQAIEDAGLIADALVIAGGGDTHWDDAARNLLEGLILHVAAAPEYVGEADLVTVRALLMAGATHAGQDGMAGLEARMHAHAEALRASAGEEAGEGMLDAADAIAFAAADFFEKPENERGSVLSTARRHTKFLDFAAMKQVLRDHSFDLTDLKTHPDGVTVFLCLPATRMSTCARWFRLFVNLALEAMERVPEPPPVPVLMVLDEFAILGHMRQIEDAAGQIAGFGVKLWPILQDLTQLKALYGERWETFMGNAGVLQFFGNNDVTTLEFIERRLGKTTIRVQRDHEITQDARNKGERGLSAGPEVHPLISAEEAARVFARDDPAGRQLVLLAGRDAPLVLERVRYYDHPAFAHQWTDCRSRQ